MTDNPLTRAILAVEIALLGDETPEAIVRAVMEAMMEPSEGMIDAAHRCTTSRLNIPGSGLTVAREKARLRWQAILRAAMDENVDCDPRFSSTANSG